MREIDKLFQPGVRGQRTKRDLPIAKVTRFGTPVWDLFTRFEKTHWIEALRSNRPPGQVKSELVLSVEWVRQHIGDLRFSLGTHCGKLKIEHRSGIVDLVLEENAGPVKYYEISAVEIEAVRRWSLETKRP